MAKLTVLHGPMFSEKSARLIDAIRQDMRAQVPHLVFGYLHPGRRNTHLVCHDPDRDGQVRTIAIHSPYQLGEWLTPETQRLYLDDVQHFDLTQWVEVFGRLMERPLGIMVAGRDRDHHGVIQETTKWCINRGDRLEWCVSQCACCGNAADRTFYRDVGNQGTILVVPGADRFEARCQECFEQGMKSCR